MSRTIEVCPNCDSPQVFNRTGKPTGQPAESEKRYHCRNCHHDFDQPREREPRGGGGPSAETLLARHMPKED